MVTTETRRWRFKGPEMEGAVAHWYTRLRSSSKQIKAYRQQASRLTADLPDGADVLEVAPGPGTRPSRWPGAEAVTRRSTQPYVRRHRPPERPGCRSDASPGRRRRMPFENESLDLVVASGVQELHPATPRAGRDAPGLTGRRYNGDPGRAGQPLPTSPARCTAWRSARSARSRRRRPEMLRNRAYQRSGSSSFV
jgi:hypothetical protein